MKHGRCVLPRLSWFHLRSFFSHFELLVHFSSRLVYLTIDLKGFFFVTAAVNGCR